MASEIYVMLNEKHLFYIIDFEFIHMEFPSFEKTGCNIITTRLW